MDFFEVELVMNRQNFAPTPSRVRDSLAIGIWEMVAYNAKAVRQYCEKGADINYGVIF